MNPKKQDVPIEQLKVAKLAYTMHETADALGISYMTVHRLVQRGKLRASNACRHKIIPVTEIERFLKDSLS